MKKLVRVSLFVLMALTLSLAIGCKHDSDPEPAKEGSRTPFVGTWVDETGDITCTINADGTFVTHVTQAGETTYEGKCHVSPDGKTVTATINEVTFTLTSKSEDTLELTLPENLGGEKVTLTKKVKTDSDPEQKPAPEQKPTPEQKPASANFVGEWVAESEGIPFTIKADGTFVMESDKKYESKYHVSPDGKTATVTITFDGEEVPLTLTSKSEDTLELTMPEEFYGKKMTLTKRVDADFAGEWKSTDGEATVTIKDSKFTTTVGEHKLEGDYTVVGKTAETSKMKIPAGLAGESEVPAASFIMKMVDGNDVMKLTVTHGEPLDMTFVKVSTEEFDLTGTWTGKVVVAGSADATIGFADNKATLTLGEATVVSTNVTQNGNFFTITWQEGNPLDLSESTGLISDSGKVWLDDGSVFTKK